MLPLSDLSAGQVISAATLRLICRTSNKCCHSQIEVADQAFYLTQSQNTDTGQTSLSTDLVTPGARQGTHWSTDLHITGTRVPDQNGISQACHMVEMHHSGRQPSGMTRPGKAGDDPPDLFTFTILAYNLRFQDSLYACTRRPFKTTIFRCQDNIFELIVFGSWLLGTSHRP